MDGRVKNGLTNDYVRNYYDTQISALPGSYTDDRWHSSPVREFEYRQTLRALTKTLSGRAYTNAIEIGPGDGVWTGLIKSYVSGSLYLVEQSEEMLTKAKERLASLTSITYEHADFLRSSPPSGADLIIAVRCFEYFDAKVEALRKMRSLLAPNGRIIIVTKNAELLTSVPATSRTLHSDQLSRKDMQRLAGEAGLQVVRTYPAVLRWLAAFPPMRGLFDGLHWLAVTTEGVFGLPFVTAHATESFVYILENHEHTA